VWLDTYRDVVNLWLTDHSGTFNDLDSVFSLSNTIRHKFKMATCRLVATVADTLKHDYSIILVEYKLKGKAQIKHLLCSVPTKYMENIELNSIVSIKGILYVTQLYLGMRSKYGVLKHITKNIS
jgi:hypothetical protein